MILLDENIAEEELLKLRSARIQARKVGLDCGRKGMSDKEIVVLLHSLKQTTFITRDIDFRTNFTPHTNYCLVWVSARMSQTAELAQKMLRNDLLNTKAKRMNKIIELSTSLIKITEPNTSFEVKVNW